jgi:hypothetical protein
MGWQVWASIDLEARRVCRWWVVYTKWGDEDGSTQYMNKRLVGCARVGLRNWGERRSTRTCNPPRYFKFLQLVRPGKYLSLQTHLLVFIKDLFSSYYARNIAGSEDSPAICSPKHSSLQQVCSQQPPHISQSNTQKCAATPSKHQHLNGSTHVLPP